MIKIKMGSSFRCEREYIVSTILGDFLGFDYEMVFGDFRDYEICFYDKKLIVKDSFFNIFENYLNIGAIPKNIIFMKNLPIIYGEDVDSALYCGLDIFGSAFFMLSRFEEFVIKDRDRFERFPSSASLAVRFGFEKLAVVDGYVEFLHKKLKALGYDKSAKSKKFSVSLECDVDHIRFWRDINFFLVRFKKALFKYHNYTQALKEISDYLSVRLRLKRDCYDRFDYLLNLSKKYNLSLTLYLLVKNCEKRDANFRSCDLLPIIKKIKRSSADLGIHPSFDSYNDLEMLKNEITEAQTLCKKVILKSRQHYLRFEMPTTLGLLEQCGIDTDSSLGYSDRVGFRCGTSKEFYAFDFINKKKLKIKESPLLVMDGALLDMNKEEAKMEILDIAKESKRYNGTFTILWHNSSFCDRWSKFEGLLEEILEEILE